MSHFYRFGTLLFQSSKLSNVRHMSELKVGATASLTKTFTERDVKSFADLSGDRNPIHIDPQYCAQTKFAKPVVHGMLTNGFTNKL